MMDEAVFIENSFREHFDKVGDTVIYGLGKNTKVILDNCTDYSIIGLMDCVRTREREWGLPILSIDEVIALGVKRIIIIATAANVPIIYKRIEAKSQEYGINVYDINGFKLEPDNGVYKLKEFYVACTEAALKEAIDRNDVISFDIFDTLLVRKVLLPTDIFEIIEERNRERFKEKGDFKNIRIKCERELYKSTNPTIYEIYDLVEKETGWHRTFINQLIQEELEAEREHLIARQKMIEIVEYAASKNKRVICTSDMYLPSDFLKNILQKSGYESINVVYVSCEQRVTKASGLFSIIKNNYPEQTILHIGDNFDADIMSAKRFEIDETFQVPSVYQMIIDGRSKDMLSFDENLSDRRELGRLFSAVFNNPFLFAETDGKCEISGNYRLGYHFIEPILAAFFEWMEEQRKSDGTNLMLLGARDGLILKKMYELRRNYDSEVPAFTYLYSSRYACTLAGMKKSDDVRYVFSMAFDGSPEEMLRKRFKLTTGEIKPQKDDESKEEYLEDYIEPILRKAEKYREKYRRYLRQVNIKDKKIGYFDFVSSGTCQLWLENICDSRMKGYYFIRNFDEYKEHLDIESYFKPKFAYERQSKLYKNYIFMENIMTSYDPTLHGFTEDGVPLFEDEQRTVEQMNRLKEIHQGILDAYKNRLDGHYPVPSQDLVDDILDMLNGTFSIMKASFFDENYLEDEFCNRKFDLKKMVEA